MTTGDDLLKAAANTKKLVQIQQICESAMKWDEDKSNPTLSDRAWLARCIISIIEEKTDS